MEAILARGFNGAVAAVGVVIVIAVLDELALLAVPLFAVTVKVSDPDNPVSKIAPVPD